MELLNNYQLIYDGDRKIFYRKSKYRFFTEKNGLEVKLGQTMIGKLYFCKTIADVLHFSIGSILCKVECTDVVELGSGFEYQCRNRTPIEIYRIDWKLLKSDYPACLWPNLFKVLYYATGYKVGFENCGRIFNGPDEHFMKYLTLLEKL